MECVVGFSMIYQRNYKSKQKYVWLGEIKGFIYYPKLRFNLKKIFKHQSERFEQQS